MLQDRLLNVNIELAGEVKRLLDSQKESRAEQEVEHTELLQCSAVQKTVCSQSVENNDMQFSS